MPKYAAPERVPTCRCADRPHMAAMFCMTGHMTECHYPLDCKTASCQHLDRYDLITPEQRQALDKAAADLTGAMADPDCQQCSGEGRIEVEVAFRIPERFAQNLAVEVPEDGIIRSREPVICRCVARASTQQS